MVSRHQKKNLRQHIRTQLFNPDESIARKSFSVGYGIFWGIFPVWGYQLAVCIPTSYLLKLNTPLVIIAANISIPPMIPVILYLSFLTGSLFVSEPNTSLHLSDMFDWQMIANNMVQYLIGSVVLAVVAGFFIGVMTYGLLRLRKR